MLVLQSAVQIEPPSTSTSLVLVLTPFVAPVPSHFLGFGTGQVYVLSTQGLICLVPFDFSWIVDLRVLQLTMAGD